MQKTSAPRQCEMLDIFWARRSQKKRLAPEKPQKGDLLSLGPDGRSRKIKICQLISLPKGAATRPHEICDFLRRLFCNVHAQKKLQFKVKSKGENGEEKQEIDGPGHNKKKKILKKKRKREEKLEKGTGNRGNCRRKFQTRPKESSKFFEQMIVRCARECQTRACELQLFIPSCCSHR